MQTVDNVQPEERTEFVFQVASASSGATVSAETAKTTIVFAASDYPMGSFEFTSEDDLFVTEVCTVTMQCALITKLTIYM